MPSLLIERLLRHGSDSDVALLQDEEGGHGRERLVSYGAIRSGALALAARLRAGRPTLAGAPVVFLAPPSDGYVETLLGILLAGGMAVPLSPLHAEPEMAHAIQSAQPIARLATRELAAKLTAVEPAAQMIILESDSPERWTKPAAPAEIRSEDPALMLFTSGTTGRPKGVVLSHSALAATCTSLDQAWGWSRQDRLLHVLPLHHTHGLVVALLGALWAGASVRFLSFDARRAWSLFGDATLFMGVPTIYAKLLDVYRAASPDERAAFRADAGRVRLFTSGSAALPAALFEEFKAATGQAILERYGMTEIGMALSNPLEGPRLPGAVGQPLPGVTVDIVSEEDRPCGPNEPGELRVRSPQIFTGYHGDPESTARGFDAQGRFRTGDTGVQDPSGIFRLLGRTSTDVLKSGGYKLSALEIEDVLRCHPAILDVAVIGLPDETWGDRVTACVVLRPSGSLTLEALRAWAKDRLAPYKLPRELKIVDELPRNAMGKIQKNRLSHYLGIAQLVAPADGR